MILQYSQTNLEPVIAAAMPSDASRVSCEIGASDGIWLSNTAYFVRNCGWRGVFVEADPVESAACRKMYRGLDAIAVNTRVTAENINLLVPPSCDLLSIDIDGNDYWVWKALRCQPAIVCIEYNHKKHGVLEVADYDPAYARGGEDYCYGASCEAIMDMADKKGYDLLHDDECCNLLFKARGR